MEDKKLKLIEALEEELERFKNYWHFKEGVDYELAIKYLKTGKHPSEYEKYNLLYGCIEDLETLYSDYGIQ